MAREDRFWPEHALNRALAATATSAALSALTAALLLSRHRFLAGLSGLGSGLALLAGRLLADRERAETAVASARVHFMERVSDLLFDASILVPLAWVMREGSNWDAILALVGLGATYLAAYERARGQALGYVGSESLGYRLTREGVLVFGLLTGWMAGALWAFVVVAGAAVGARVWNIVRQERRAGSSREASP